MSLIHIINNEMHTFPFTLRYLECHRFCQRPKPPEWCPRNHSQAWLEGEVLDVFAAWFAQVTSKCSVSQIDKSLINLIHWNGDWRGVSPASNITSMLHAMFQYVSMQCLVHNVTCEPPYYEVKGQVSKPCNNNKTAVSSKAHEQTSNMNAQKHTS